MEISLAIILSRLEMEVELHLSGDCPSFKTVELYDGTPPQPGTLVICPLSEALGAAKRPGVFYMCVRDRMPDEHENRDSLEQVIVVKRNIGFKSLFNCVQKTFCEVNSWIMSMERSISAHEGMQELLRLSEPVFKNFITIQDGTFKLLARTKNIEPTDEVMRRLVKYGYHPPETMELFRKFRRIEQYYTSTDIVVDRDHVTTSYDVVKKTLHTGNSLYFLVIMVCNSRPADDGTVELFRILTGFIKRIADAEIASNGTNSSGIRKLAVDIITGSVGNEEEARVRATYCGFSFDKPLRLYVVAFRDSLNIPLDHLVRKLTGLMSGCVTLLYESRILIMRDERTNADAFRTALGDALRPLGYICGVSDSFNSIWRLSMAYEQSLVALDIASRLKSSGVSEERFFRFSDTYLYKIILSGISSSHEMFAASSLCGALIQLRRYDSSHGTDIYSIMRSYLENERRATKVAEIMHLHRNTILHHVERGEKLLGISLENPITRLELLIAFRAADVEGTAQDAE